MKRIMLLLTLIALSGCTTVGTLGIITRSTGDPGAVLKNAQPFKELGRVEGEACRYFVLGVMPWGDANLSKAVDTALDKVGGDALINVTVSNSLYGFIPVYNLFSYTCTDVKGIAIKF